MSQALQDVLSQIGNILCPSVSKSANVDDNLSCEKGRRG